MSFTVVQRRPFSAALVAGAFTEPDLYRSFSGLTKVDVPEIVDDGDGLTGVRTGRPPVLDGRDDER